MDISSIDASSARFIASVTWASADSNVSRCRWEARRVSLSVYFSISLTAIKRVFFEYFCS